MLIPTKINSPGVVSSLRLLVFSALESTDSPRLDLTYTVSRAVLQFYVILVRDIMRKLNIYIVKKFLDNSLLK